MLKPFKYLVSQKIGCILVSAALMLSSLTSIADEIQSNNDTEKWLQWLGVTAATAQADHIIQQEVSRLLERKSIADSRLQSLHKQLILHTGSEIITTSVNSFVMKNFPESDKQLEVTLLDPLMLRARNFDVALEMTNAFKKFKSFDNRRRLNEPVSDKRLALIKRLDEVQRTSKIAALLQTELNITAGQLAAKLEGKRWTSSDPEWLSLQRQQRESHMKDVIIRLHLFSYRFMKDNELEGYIKLLDSHEVQLLLDTSMKGIQESLTAARLNAIK